MEFADRARELAARLQMERDLVTFPDRPMQVFSSCTLMTMNDIHKFLYELSGPIQPTVTHAIAVGGPAGVTTTNSDGSIVLADAPKKRRVIKHRGKKVAS